MNDDFFTNCKTKCISDMYRLGTYFFYCGLENRTFLPQPLIFRKIAKTRKTGAERGKTLTLSQI